MTSWTAMRLQDINATAPLTLFDTDATDNSGQVRPDDACGTPDLFSSL
jgi:hypothetical protein